MQVDPVYDFPDPSTGGVTRASPQRGSLKNISVLDRLLLTHPVWLQLSINSATALHILQREPPGTFLVRKSTTSQKKVLCVRLGDDSVPSFVKQFIILERDSMFSLDRSAISFPDLCRLIAFYCVSRDVLPFTLELPEAIVRASSHKQLESISHMGVEFWSSALNFRGPRNGPPAVVDTLPRPCSPAPQISPAPLENPTLFEEFCPIRTRSPLELDLGAGQGALCFINPLFLQEQPGRNAIRRRHRFKHSIKIRVSTETSGPLSPPQAPPPPPPLLAKCKKKRKPASQADATGQKVEGDARGDGVEPETEDPGCRVGAEVPGKAGQDQGDLDYLLPCQVLPMKAYTIVSPMLSPTPEEEDYRMPKALRQAQEEAQGEEDDEEEDVVLALERNHAPSLGELDSCSSLSSLEEAEETFERPPLTRGISNPPTPSSPVPRHSTSALRKMSVAFVSFFVPERRVARLVEDLSRDRRLAFGTLVQDFLRKQREELKPPCESSASEILQGLRLFLSQAKNFLLESGELQPPIETLLPEEEKDQALEKAMFRCILKPLKPQIDTALRSLHERDGALYRLEEGLRRAREGSPLELFGVCGGIPDAQGIEKVKRKLADMQRTFSPIDKMLLLLQICKLIYRAMEKSTGKEFGADEFLPVLSYVLVQSSTSELSIEVEYMMELLDNQWLVGEGGYYLTSVYACQSLIESQSEPRPPGLLTNHARETLHTWSRRRSNNACSQTDREQKFVRVLFQAGEDSQLKTLQWRSGVSAEALAQVCAAKFEVNPEEYALYWRTNEVTQPIPPDAQIHDLHSPQGSSGSPLLYQSSSLDGKAHKLTRGGAVDITES